MDATYVSWIWHGEEATLNNSTDDNDQLREEEHKFVDEDPINMVNAAYDEYVEDPNKFFININKDIVYMLDPLGPHLRSDDWKHVVDMAMKMFHAVGNRKKGRSKTSWEIVKVSMEYKKEKEKRDGRRSSRRLAEQARQAMLKTRKAAHGGHEVGDTSTDPLSENEVPRNNSSPNSSSPTQESSYSPSGYAPTPPRAKSKASKGTGSSSRKK
nr:transposase [Ipomoea batatas]